MKDVAIGLAVGLLITLGLYFFWHVPEVNKAYQRGLAECVDNKDTLYIPGKDSIVYREKKIYVEKPAGTTKDSTFWAYIDTTIVSGKDTISISIDVSEVKARPLADWVIGITHMDYTEVPDTIKIYDTITEIVIEKEIDWLWTLIGTVAGAIGAAVLLLSGG